MTPAICRDCHAGRCHDCDSTAFDYTTDTPCACACWARDHNLGDLL